MPLKLTDKELVDNELMREIVRIRIDTAWRMLYLADHNLLPPIDSEKATGDFDDKGALFLPGPYIFQDSERRHVVYPKRDTNLTVEAFRERVRGAMRHDNATLLYPRALVSGINLDNSFFLELSRNIMYAKSASRKNTITLAENNPVSMSSDDIARSYCPQYIPMPYGSRTKLSGALSVCVNHPHLYFISAHQAFSFREQERIDYWAAIRSIMREPMISAEGILLAHPVVITCHNTRYKDDAFTGLTRIGGYGTFGEFATITIERLSKELLSDTGKTKESVASDELVANHNGIQLVCVLRSYPHTTPGKRLLKGVTTKILHPEKDLRIDVHDIEDAAKVRYFAAKN